MIKNKKNIHNIKRKLKYNNIVQSGGGFFTNDTPPFIYISIIIYFCFEIVNLTFTLMILLNNNICDKNKYYFINDNNNLKKLFFVSNIITIFLAFIILITIDRDRKNKYYIYNIIYCGISLIYIIINIIFITFLHDYNTVECNDKIYFEYSKITKPLLFTIIATKLLLFILSIIYIIILYLKDNYEPIILQKRLPNGNQPIHPIEIPPLKKPPPTNPIPIPISKRSIYNSPFIL